MTIAEEDENQDLDYKATIVPDPEISIDPTTEGKAERIPKQRRQLFQIEHQRIESPFLPPEYLEKYEQISPGMGIQLMQVILEHQKFQMEVKRTEMELAKKSFAESVKVNDANIREQDELNKARSREIDIKSRGQIFALIITFTLLLSAFGFALLKLPFLSGACIAIIVAMAVVMFLQKTQHDKAGEEQPGQEQVEDSV